MISSCIFIILGTIIGAGFASGKEIYTFFYAYGVQGIFGIIIASIIIGFIIYKTLKIIKKYNITNYSEFLNIVVKKENKYIDYKKVIEIIVNTFLLMTFFVMCAGFSAYFKQEFEINVLLSSIIVACFCYFILGKNMKGILLINWIIMPIIIIILIWLTIRNGGMLYKINMKTVDSVTWLVKAILYASYNSITLVSILISLKKYIKNKKDIFVIAISCTIIILVLAFIIFSLINNIEGDMKKIEMPAVYAAGTISILAKYLYGLIILGAITTTALSSAFGFLNNVSKNVKQYRKYNKCICFISVFSSCIGFSNLVNNVYPVFGILGLVQLILILKCK